jgi:hypothetical protein
MIKRILGMDNDHDPIWFVCEDCKTEYSCLMDLINFLSKPHKDEIQVKIFEPTHVFVGKMEKYTYAQMREMWDFLEGYTNPPFDLTGDEIFEMFWDSAD